MEKILVVMNRGSGHDDKGDSESLIRAELERAGRDFELLKPASPDTLCEEIRAAVTRHGRPGVLVAAGGDGTLNAVAEAALESGWTLGIVPLGTFNYFARDLGLPLEPAAATRALLEGHVRRVHVGRVNGRLFLNNASFGLYRKLLEERERMKRRFGRYRAIAVIAALATLWRFDRSYRVELDVDGRREHLRTALLFFGLNTLQLENLELAVAECTAGSRLALIAPRTSSRWRLLWLALKGAAHRLEGSPGLSCRCASRVRVDWPGHTRARVALDGESAVCDLPLVVEVQPGALPVLLPAEPGPRA